MTATPASAVEVVIDPSAFHSNPDGNVSPTIGGNEQDLNVERDSLRGDDESELDQSESDEDKEDADWCLWSALAGLASEFASGEEPNVDEALEDRLLKCFKSYFDGKPEEGSIYWLAKAMTIRDNLDLLETLGYTGEQAWNQLMNGGVTLPADEWQRWFSEDAASVPPVG